MDLKVGDLVYCPVNLQTGEMFGPDKELAIIVTIYEKEQMIKVVYVSDDLSSKVVGSWHTSEIELINTE